MTLTSLVVVQANIHSGPEFPGQVNLMLKEVVGDILLTKAEALAHGVAPNDNFSNG
jgi:hypothetical protein